MPLGSVLLFHRLLLHVSSHPCVLKGTECIYLIRHWKSLTLWSLVLDYSTYGGLVCICKSQMEPIIKQGKYGILKLIFTGAYNFQYCVDFFCTGAWWVTVHVVSEWDTTEATQHSGTHMYICVCVYIYMYMYKCIYIGIYMEYRGSVQSTSHI